MNIGTLVVHGHSAPDQTCRGVVPPIYLTTTYRSEKFGVKEKFAYSRGSHPNREYLEAFIAELEGGSRGFAFSSGMTAIAAALAVLKTGDKVLLSKNVYGGTVALLNGFFRDFGLRYELADTGNTAELESQIDEYTKAILVETPSNPLLDITDIEAVSTLAKKYGIIVIVDNTFLSPYLQNPLLLGADIVVESATKFLGGHSDVIAGTAVTNDNELAEKMGNFQRTAGGILQPFDIYLLIRGIKTLSIRIDRQVENTWKIVKFLRECPEVDKVLYPGLPEHPGYAIHRKQAKSPGSMVSFLLNKECGIAPFFEALKHITWGASLGSLETLIQHPATGSHAAFSQEQREYAGIADNLIRLSVGIEDAADLIEDLNRAFTEGKIHGGKGA